MVAKLKTTHTLMENKLVVYRRERSSIWQCRYKVGGVWQRASTNERDLKAAKESATKLMIVAEIRKQDNLPVVTRRFRDVAKLAIQRMDAKVANGEGKVAYNDYKLIIVKYLIPILGNRLIGNIDHQAIEHLNEERTRMMGKAPSKSTMLSHNAALNVIFDEGVMRNFLTDMNRPKLEAKGKKSEVRPAFELNELKAVLANFPAWIQRGKNAHSRELRQLMCDYVEMLVDTGARPGIELMNLKWKQIKFSINAVEIDTGVIDNTDDEHESIILTNLNRTVEMTVKGKTGRRQIIGRQPTVKVLERIAARNYGEVGAVINPFQALTKSTNDDYVLRTKDEKLDVSNSFQKMLESYLTEHNLLNDSRTNQNRVFYSFRHTYATLALTHDRVPIHTLAHQMGTSVLMIERHYSHLKVIEALEQLRGEETRRRIATTQSADEIDQFSYVGKVKKSVKNAQ